MRWLGLIPLVVGLYLFWAYALYYLYNYNANTRLWGKLLVEVGLDFWAQLALGIILCAGGWYSLRKVRRY